MVVAARGDRALLDPCLAALLPQCAEHGAELVVAHAGALGDLESAYPAVRFVSAAPGTQLPALRAAGMAATDGDVVVLTEDHCVAAPDWLGLIVAAQRSGVDVVGGPMENARPQRSLDWAAYLAEYGTYLAGPPSGAPPE